MATYKVTLFLILAMFSVMNPVLAVQSGSSGHSLTINSQTELADYIKALLGNNHENMSEELKKYVAENKISIMNAVQEVALILNEVQPQQNANNFDISSRFITLLGESASKVKLYSTLQEQAQTQINQNLKSGPKKVHHIFGNAAEIQKMNKMFKKHQKRLLQETMAASNTQPTVSFSYITKFFFGLLFIIVCLSLFLSIACMENRKDTLLYAKFIADVGR